MRLLILLLLLSTAASLKICGNYCGPGWCDGMAIDEKDCLAKLEPDPEYLLADSCCKAHDICCGHGNRSVCNDELIKCIFKTTLLAAPWEPICDGNLIGDFFYAMDWISLTVDDRAMCCGTFC